MHHAGFCESIWSCRLCCTTKIRQRTGQQIHLGVHGNTLSQGLIQSGQFGTVAATSKPKSTVKGFDLIKKPPGQQALTPPLPRQRQNISSSPPDKHNEPLHFANDRRWDRCSTPAIDPACRARCPPPIITAAHSSIMPAPPLKVR